MSPLFTDLVLLSAAVYVLLIVWDLRVRRWTALFELGGLTFFLALLHWAVGFPRPAIAFGGTSTIQTIVILYIFTILGGVASYFFYLRGLFSWRAFLRPLFVSPILFMPLMGSIRASQNVETLQLISLALLAFQQGFFWKVVFERAQKKV
jgi:hypothetical protein